MQKKLLDMFTVLIFCVYAFLLYTKNVTLPGYLPDDIWIASIVEHITADYWHQENYLGYGIGFWKFLNSVLVYNRHDENILFLRKVLLLVSLVTPASFLYLLPGPRIRLWGFLWWLSFPVAWWSGKIIAVDPVLMSLSAVMLVFLLRPQVLFVRALGARVCFASALCGLAAGMKLNALPLFLLPLCVLWRPVGLQHYQLQFWTSRLYQSLLCLLCFGVGFVLMNPSTVFRTQEFLTTFRTDPIYWPNVISILFTPRWEWDIAYSGGLFPFTVAPVILGFFVWYAILYLDSYFLCSVLLVFAAFVTLFLRHSPFYFWYWMPFVPVLVGVFYSTPRCQKQVRLLALLVVASWVCQGGAIYRSWCISSQLAANQQHKDDIVKCLQQKLGQQGFLQGARLFFNYPENTFVVPTESATVQPPRINYDQGASWTVLKRNFSLPEFSRWSEGNFVQKTPDKVVAVLPDRLFLTQETLPGIAYFKLVKREQCGGVGIYSNVP